MVTAESANKTIGFEYDSDGLRTKKTVSGGATHYYFYAGGQLLRETYGSNVLDFSYDANGYPYALKYNGTTYYYITNLQGDVMYLVDGTGATVAAYEYDPYGNILSAIGPMAEITPLRYRGYYYDAELEMYYLQSRYYDPMVGRFINADDVSLLGVKNALQSFDLFTYCENNPTFSVDYTGCLSIPSWTITWAIDAAILAVASYWQITWMSYAAPIKFMAKKVAVTFFKKTIAPVIQGITNVIVKILAQTLAWIGQKAMAASINFSVKAGIAGILAEPLRAITMITSFGGLVAGIFDYMTDKKFDGVVRF